MMPEHDIAHDAPLEKALALKKLQSKYGIKKDRYIKIWFPNNSFFYASGSILELWAKKYGAKTKLDDAISKWEEELKVERKQNKEENNGTA